MKFHVTIRSFNHITDKSEVNEMRQLIGKKLQQFKESGKMLDGAVFLDERAAYFVFEVDSEDELFHLLVPIHDIADIELHPLVSFDTMEHFFQEELEAAEA